MMATYALFLKSLWANSSGSFEANQNPANLINRFWQQIAAAGGGGLTTTGNKTNPDQGKMPLSARNLQTPDSIYFAFLPDAGGVQQVSFICALTKSPGNQATVASPFRDAYGAVQWGVSGAVINGTITDGTDVYSSLGPFVLNTDRGAVGNHSFYKLTIAITVVQSGTTMYYSYDPDMDVDNGVGNK